MTQFSSEEDAGAFHLCALFASGMEVRLFGSVCARVSNEHMCASDPRCAV